MTTMTDHHIPPETDVHPVDIAQTLAEECSWDFDRVGEDQIAVAVEGAWRTYSLSMNWSGHESMVRVLCTLELNPPEERLDPFFSLLNLVNDQIWSGSFTLWRQQGLLSFRSGLTLAGEAHATPEQIECLFHNALGLCERFYPAFQLVAFGDEEPEKAIEIAIEEAYGTA